VFGCAGIVAGGLWEPAVPALWAGLILLAGAALVGLRVRQSSDWNLPDAAVRAMLASDEGWCVVRAAGASVFANEAFQRLAGAKTPDGLIARAGDHARQTLERALGSEGRGAAEIEMNDGRRLRLSVESAVAEDGMRIWHLSDVTNDSSEGEARREEEARMAVVLDAVPIAVFTATDDGGFTSVNQSLAALLGEPGEALVGRRLDDFLAEPSENQPVDASSVVRLKGADGMAFDSLLAQQGDVGVIVPLPHITKGSTGPLDDRFKAIFQSAPIGIALLDADTAIIECNRAFPRILLDRDAALQGQSIDALIGEAERAEVREALLATLGGEHVSMPLELRSGDASDRVTSLYASRIEGGGDGEARLIAHLIDTTEQKSLELQFAQAQKMQAVGQLAGGIAHDFNNLLTAIIGFCDLLLQRHQAGDHSFADLQQIKQNSNRAANLVRQLLAFSRQQTLKPETLSLTDVLAEASNLVRRLMGEKIELKMIHGRDVGFVKADQGQLEQVIVNLAVNARDAMVDGGTLTIQTSTVSQTESVRMGHELLPSGGYSLIEVTDTGCGIPKAHLGKIFEPFYTTKDVGAGTGLGLSTVYGIVKQFGGYVFVDSTEGEGTVISVFLPEHVPDKTDRKSAADGDEKSSPRDLTGRGKILLVEDEDAVRMFGARALRNKGYEVIEADCGEAALELMETENETIDLLVTDVVMPGVDGPTLTKRIQETRPDLKVIFISGYAEDAFRSSVDESINFLPKPFSLSQLATKVKEVMSDA
jgi:two-component system cell cycle sensor histidine kinase/response regulator CckA